MPVTVRFDPTSVSKQAQIIPDASKFNDGVMTAEMVKELEQGTVANDNVIIHVPADYATVDEALAAFPPGNRKQAQLIIAPGTYDVDLSSFNPPTPVGPTGTPLIITGDYTNEVGTITESVGDVTGTHVTDPALTLAVNAYEGNAFLLCLTGANAGIKCQVRKNSATTISVMGSFYLGPIAIGDTFILQRPAVTLNAVSDFNASKRIFGLQALNLVLPNTVAVRNCYIAMEGVVIDGNGTGFHEWFPHNTFLSAAFSVGGAWEVAGVDSPFALFNPFVGTCFQNIPDFSGSDSLWDGIFFFLNGGPPSLDGCDLFMPNVETDNCPLLVGQSAHVSFFGSIMGGRAAFNNSPSAGITFDGSVGVIDDHDIVNSAGDGVLAQNNAFVTVNNVGGINTGAGIHPMQRSQICFDPLTTAVTGSSDTLVDGVAQSYVAVTPDGYNGLSGAVLTFNRVSPIGL